MVGRALNARKKKPKDPQTFLWNSNHPYSPFVGNALKWDSYVYDDGTTCEWLSQPRSAAVADGSQSHMPWARAILHAKEGDERMNNR